MTPSAVHIYANEFTISTSERDLIITFRFKNHAALGEETESYVILSPESAQELAAVLTQGVAVWQQESE